MNRLAVIALAGSLLWASVAAAQSPSTPTAKPMSQPVQSPKANDKPKTPLPFEVMAIEVVDSLAKTQIEVHAAATSGLKDISEAQVRDYLQSLYADKPSFEAYMRNKRFNDKLDVTLLEKQTGIPFRKLFRFSHQTSDRRDATHFYAMVYASKKEMTSVANWVGRLSWRQQEGKPPEVEIRQARLVEARQPSTKFGLTLQQRQSIYQEALALEHQVYAEASTKYREEDDRHLGYTRATNKVHRAALARKYKISVDQLWEIVAEAVEKGWPR